MQNTKTDKYPLSDEEFKNIYGKVPRLTVEVLVKTSEGLVLTKRAIEPCVGKWHIPGGTVHFEETLVDAVKRVAEDELGVSVVVGENVGYIEYPFIHEDGYEGWPIGIVFETTIESGELRGSEQGEEFGMFSEVPADIVREQAEFLGTYFEARR